MFFSAFLLLGVRIIYINFINFIFRYNVDILINKGGGIRE